MHSLGFILILILMWVCIGMGFEKNPRQGVGVSKVYLHEFGCQILNRVSLKKYFNDHLGVFGVYGLDRVCM